MVGDDTLRDTGPLSVDQLHMTCARDDNRIYASNSTNVTRGFPDGLDCRFIEVALTFPECSNGNADSDNHKVTALVGTLRSRLIRGQDHVVYKVNGTCPETHKIAIARIMLLAEWDLRPMVARKDEWKKCARLPARRAPVLMRP
jgi:hypothetical protein